MKEFSQLLLEIRHRTLKMCLLRHADELKDLNLNSIERQLAAKIIKKIQAATKLSDGDFYKLISESKDHLSIKPYHELDIARRVVIELDLCKN